MKKLLGLAVLSCLVAVFTFAGPVWAEGVDSRIRALEGELAKLKTQQMELKKEATAAADALPTFSYRPGRGMTISGPDKSWAFNIAYRVNIHMYNHLDGRSYFHDEGEIVPDDESQEDATTVGELDVRRNRMSFNFCWDDCFIEIQNSFDGETPGRQLSWRDQEVGFHFENWNPWLPYFSIGVRRGAGDSHLSRSSDSDAKLEHHAILDFGSWAGDGSHAGMGVQWDGVEIGSGEFNLYLNFETSQGEDHQNHLRDDRKGFKGFFSILPWSKSKSKWLEGFEPGIGVQLHSIGIDPRNGELATYEDKGQQTVMDTEDIGKGFAYMLTPGVRWVIGPYMIRANYFRTHLEGRNDDNRGLSGKGFEIANQMFIWSPKGFMTGSRNTAGSLLVGWSFDRSQVECGAVDCNVAAVGSRQTMLNRELGVWYFIRPSMRVGTWWNWYQVKNTPTQTQVAVGCKKDITSAEAGKGASRECNWHTLNAGFQLRW